jgi:hypothetical protein
MKHKFIENCGECKEEKNRLSSLAMLRSNRHGALIKLYSQSYYFIICLLENCGFTLFTINNVMVHMKCFNFENDVNAIFSLAINVSAINMILKSFQPLIL